MVWNGSISEQIKGIVQDLQITCIKNNTALMQFKMENQRLDGIIEAMKGMYKWSTDSAIVIFVNRS